MTGAEIIGQVITQLKNSSDLTSVDDNNIFAGVRDTMPVFPAITVDPSENILDNDDLNSKETITMSVSISGYVKVEDPDLQLAGSGGIVGIMDLEENIKSAIRSDRTLSGECIDMNIVNSRYENENWPIRSVTITVDIFYRQTY